jgi:UDP-glucose 4-epimerase
MSLAPIRKAAPDNAAATHLIKVAAETALGLRPKLEIFGTDYPTPDGTCIRDYIHVSDLAAAHALALRNLRAGGAPLTLNCGYGHGFSVREVIDTVKRVAGIDFMAEDAPRRQGDPARIVAASKRIRDDLSTIVTHALDWERRLTSRFPRGALSRGLAETPLKSPHYPGMQR